MLCLSEVNVKRADAAWAACQLRQVRARGQISDQQSVRRGVITARAKLGKCSRRFLNAKSFAATGLEGQFLGVSGEKEAGRDQGLVT